MLQFLTELTRLFQKCRSSGSVYITLKKCKQPPGPGQRGAAAGRGQPGGRLLSGSPDSRASGSRRRWQVWLVGLPAPTHRDRRPRVPGSPVPAPLVRAHVPWGVTVSSCCPHVWPYPNHLVMVDWVSPVTPSLPFPPWPQQQCLWRCSLRCIIIVFRR